MQRRRGLGCAQLLTAHLYSLLRRSKRLGYCSDDLPAVADLFSAADDELFRRTTSSPNHVLHPYLPGETDVPYQLRTRSHRMTLINKTKFLSDADFYHSAAVQTLVLVIVVIVCLFYYVYSTHIS